MKFLGVSTEESHALEELGQYPAIVTSRLVKKSLFAIDHLHYDFETPRLSVVVVQFAGNLEREEVVIDINKISLTSLGRHLQRLKINNFYCEQLRQ